MYPPLLVFDRASSMLLGVRLQAGSAHAAEVVVGTLKPIVAALRRAFPRTRIIVRADAGFAVPRLYDFCERHGLQYLISIAPNEPFKAHTDWGLERLCERFGRTAAPCRYVAGFWHQAARWSSKRRIIYKVEAGAEGTNRRFLVTNMKGLPVHLWRLYCDRGTAEGFIEQLKNALKADRLSCHRFVAAYSAEVAFGYEGRKRLPAPGVRLRLQPPARLRLEALRHRPSGRLDRDDPHQAPQGRGGWDGGEGVRREVEFLAPMAAAIVSERRVRRPYGLNGAEDGQPGRNALVRNGRVQVLPGRTQVAVEVGDVFVIETPGSGGYNPSLAEWAAMAPQAARALCRRGRWGGPAAGIAYGHVQANLVVVPASVADDFEAHAAPTPSRARCWSGWPQAIPFPARLPSAPTSAPTCLATGPTDAAGGSTSWSTLPA